MVCKDTLFCPINKTTLVKKLNEYGIKWVRGPRSVTDKLSKELNVPACQSSLELIIDKIINGDYKDVIDICSIIQEIRKQDELVPVIFTSARDQDLDKILGLELGSDDYITKPFQIREVMARIKANLRKVEITNMNNEMNLVKEKEDKDDIIKVGDLSLDLKRVEAKVKDEVINLTKKEFDVLKYLASQPGQVVTRENLLREVWEYEEYVGAIRTIDVTMNRIRDKIEKDKANPKILITKRGSGYYVTDKK